MGGNAAFITKNRSLVQLVNFAYGSLFWHSLANAREMSSRDTLQLSKEGKEDYSLVPMSLILGPYIHHHFSWLLII